MPKRYCPHCWPTKRRSHLGLHLEHHGGEFLNLLSLPFIGAKKIKVYRHHLWGAMLEFLSWIRAVEFDIEPDETRLYNRGLIFFHEAKRRGWTIGAVKFLGRYTQEFRLVYQGKKYHYEGIPLHIAPVNHDLDDKYKVKILLEKNGLPVAQGRVFANIRRAWQFASTIGYPLVVKPANGSLSHHATFPINSSQQLQKAMEIAKIYKPRFIVERYIPGNLYRATVVGRKHIFVCQKERANVVGDGRSSLRKLIQKKNQQKNRGQTQQMNTTLHKILFDEALEGNLLKQKLDWDSVPAKSKKIYLQNKFILSAGCDIIGCTDQTHPDNKRLFLQIARLMETDLVGIDFISPDIGKSYKNQLTAVLETNSLPYIDMHQYPSHGQGDPVAEIVWDLVREKLEQGEYVGV